MQLLKPAVVTKLGRRIARMVDRRIEARVTRMPQFVALEQKMRFMVVENIRLNQVIRELIYWNELSRAVTGSQTKQSFDYQWREVPAGEAMPSNPKFLATVPDMILERTRLPREWFQGKRVLDAGCGSGRWSYGLAKLGAHVTAVDQSAGARAAAKALVEPVGKIEVLEQDLLRMTVPERSFDLVWCFGVCHHTENTMLAMKNVMDRVAPGGWLFMMLYGTPESVPAFSEQALYEEWRRKLLPLPFEKKVELLKQNFPPEQVHGYFDAVSPMINDLVTWEWTEAFLKDSGFDSIARTIDHPNHHFVGRRIPR